LRTQNEIFRLKIIVLKIKHRRSRNDVFCRIHCRTFVRSFCEDSAPTVLFESCLPPREQLLHSIAIAGFGINALLPFSAMDEAAEIQLRCTLRTDYERIVGEI
jgi:hypothetical protein